MKEKSLDKKSLNVKSKKMHKKKSLQEKGITLIALVVTIIILLILAGVTLNMALSQNGLFSKTQEAADKYKQAQEDEEIEIEKIEYAADGKDITEVQKISSKDEFKEFREKVNQGENFNNTLIKLYCDIDLENEEWTPIGTSTNPFNGVFNGNGHTIKNIKLNKKNEECKGEDNFYYIGLFGYNKGVIKNIVIDGNDIDLCQEVSENEYISVGTIAGYSEGIIENCCNKANINVAYISRIGGIAGRVLNTGEISKCCNKGVIKILKEDNNKRIVGGICAYTQANTTIDSCYNEGNIIDTTIYHNDQIGGIAGNSLGDIDSCYNIAEVHISNVSGEELGYEAVAGIVGQTNKGSILNCYNIGKIILEGNTRLNRWASILGGTYDPDSSVIVDNCYMCDNLNKTYCWPVDLSSGNETEKKSDLIKDATVIEDGDKESLHEKLGSKFKKDESGSNNGYPILEWQ